MSGKTVDVVSGEHDRRAVAMKISEQVNNFVTGAHIDTRGWFIENEQFGIAMKGAGEEYSLLLAAGELADVTVFETAESELLE